MLKAFFVVLFIFSVVYFRIIFCVFLVNECCFFSFILLFIFFSVWNIFLDLSKLGIDVKYMFSKIYIKEFYEYLGYICVLLLIYFFLLV